MREGERGHWRVGFIQALPVAPKRLIAGVGQVDAQRSDDERRDAHVLLVSMDCDRGIPESYRKLPDGNISHSTIVTILRPDGGMDLAVEGLARANADIVARLRSLLAEEGVATKG